MSARPAPASPAATGASSGIRVAAAVGAALLLASCAGSGAQRTDSPGADAASSPSAAGAGELTVFAAASMRTALEEVGAEFTATHPQVHLRFSYAGSADLVTQVSQGAPADVLITADETAMDQAVADGDVTGSPTVVATNTLTLVTPPDDPAGITSFDALPTDALLITCAPQVPCGRATEALAQAAGVSLHPASQESSVTDVLGKVTSGQADAGIVYITDAVSAGDAVRRIEIPQASQVVNRCPAAVVAGSDAQGLAADFVEFLAGPQAQDVLRADGFGAP